MSVLTDKQIDAMASRFLEWRLPGDFNPDRAAGVVFNRPSPSAVSHGWPTGTNLFSYAQAKAMVLHMAERVPVAINARDAFRPTLGAATALAPAPIPLRLNCPDCGLLHVDEGEWATKAHHTHACQGCGLVWRPAIVPTVGVEFLPGYKNHD